MSPIVLAITGASGAAYAVRLLDVLLANGQDVHLTLSPSAVSVMHFELGLTLDLDNFEVGDLRPDRLMQGNELARSLAKESAQIAPGATDLSRAGLRGQATYHHYRDFSAGIASGSFLTAGMVICPCSMGTLASVANGLSANLIHRAADVHLKERRKLIVVPRETPLGSIQLQNMKNLADAGAVILPAMPGFYHQPNSILDLVDFVVGRICDQLGMQNKLMARWGEIQDD